MKYPLIQVLLVTDHAESWLPDLLRSLERQTYPNWQLMVCDQSSGDATVEQLQAWQKNHPQLLKHLILHANKQRVIQSLNELVEASCADYLMLCDQEDIWFPEKIELQFAAMQVLEKEAEETLPLLIHSDLAVIDSDKEILCPSFWEYRGLDIQQRAEAYLLNNPVMSSVTLFNRTAANAVFPIPQQELRAEHWLALICAWFGKVHALPHPTILYRWHEKRSAKQVAHLAQRLELWSRQANAFLQRFAGRLDEEDLHMLKAVATLSQLKGWQRRKHIVQHRLFKQGVMDNVALLLLA